MPTNLAADVVCSLKTANMIGTSLTGPQSNAGRLAPVNQPLHVTSSQNQLSGFPLGKQSGFVFLTQIKIQILNNERIIDSNRIVAHFEKFIPVSDKLKAELVNRVSLVFFSKGDLIIDAGRISSRSYYVLNGLTRTYFTKEGREINEYFSSENEWANSPRSWRTGKTDIYYVAAIEDTTALCINVDDMIFLFENFPEMDRYGRLSMTTLLDHLIERIASFRFTTAEEKYIHFKKTYSNTHHRIPLGMVASYLGIAQETLSRLRAKK